MNANNINIFVSTKNIDKNERVSNFTLNFPQDYLKANSDQGIKINVIHFDADNSMYNINDNNNSFEIIKKDVDDNVIESIPLRITNGNYNVKTLKDHLNNIMNGYVSVSYDKNRNRYTYYSMLSDFKIYINIINCNQFLGLDDTNLIPNEGLESYIVNMNYRRKIILKVIGLSYEVASIENMGVNNNFENSSVLFWIDKSDVEPFKRISYHNEDGGDSYNYNVYDKNITRLRLILEDENEKEYTDLKDYNVILQFSILQRDKQEMVILTTQIMNILKETYTLILMALEYFNII